MGAVRILQAVSGGLTALLGVVVAYPGDLVPQEVVLALAGASAFSQAMVVILLGGENAGR